MRSPRRAGLSAATDLPRRVDVAGAEVTSRPTTRRDACRAVSTLCSAGHEDGPTGQQAATMNGWRADVERWTCRWSEIEVTDAPCG